MSKAMIHLPQARKHKTPGRRASQAAPVDAPAPRTTPAGAMPDGPTFMEPEQRRAMIAEAAYFRSERRGFEPGHELEDWVAAESDVEHLSPLPGAPMVSGS